MVCSILVFMMLFWARTRVLQVECHAAGSRKSEPSWNLRVLLDGPFDRRARHAPAMQRDVEWRDGGSSLSMRMTGSCGVDSFEFVRHAGVALDHFDMHDCWYVHRGSNQGFPTFETRD